MKVRNKTTLVIANGDLEHEIEVTDSGKKVVIEVSSFKGTQCVFTSSAYDIMEIVSYVQSREKDS